jgi:hypothetical protein
MEVLVDLSFWVGTVIGLAGLVFGYYWYLQTKIVIDPRYSLDDELIIDVRSHPLQGQVKITSNEAPVQQLSRCTLVLWNAGRQTLRMDDFAPGSAGPIVLLSGHIVGSPEVLSNRPECSPSVLADGNTLSVQFSFLDRGDVLVATTLYDGQGEASPEFKAVIMGVPQGVRKSWAWSYDDLRGSGGSR